jgi:hypothetical protein
LLGRVKGLGGVQVAAGGVDREPVGRPKLGPAALDHAGRVDALDVGAEVVRGEHGAVGRAGDAVGHPEPADEFLGCAAVGVDQQQAGVSDESLGQRGEDARISAERKRRVSGA